MTVQNTQTADEQAFEPPADFEKELFESQIAELRVHRCATGELLGPFAMDQAKLQEDASFSKKVKLTHKPGDAFMYVVPSEEDWLHDALDEVRITPGTIYAKDEPFIEGSSALTGYFQDDDTERWVYVETGRVPVDAEGQPAWRGDLLDFPEVATEFEECMQVPEYRHAAEQAAYKAMYS